MGLDIVAMMKARNINCVFYESCFCNNVKKTKFFGLLRGSCNAEIAVSCELRIKHKRKYVRKEKR